MTSYPVAYPITRANAYGVSPASLGRAGGSSGFPLSGAIIDEWFTSASYYPGPITSDLVDTRSTTKYVTDLSGLLSSVAINTLPISNAGLLNEPAATNIILQSGNQNSASYSSSVTGSGSITVTGNAGAAPDGTITATKLALSRSAAADRAFRYQNFTATNAIYTGSYYVAAFGAGDIGKQIGVNFYNGTVNVGSQTIVLTAAYQRITLSATLSTAANNNFSIGYIDGVGTQTGATNVLISFAQIELGSSASSYVPTTAASATRSADSIQIQPTGIGTLNLTFSDGTTQSVFTSPTAKYALAGLNKTLITRLTGYAATVPFRQAVSTTFLPNATVTTNAQAGARQFVTARVRIDSLKVVIPNFSGAEVNSGGTLTCSAGIEYNGVFTPFKFSGAATGSTSGNLLTSDELSIYIRSGDSFYIRLWGSSSNSTFCVGDHFPQPNGGVAQFGATVPDTTTGSGSITNTATGIMWGACALVARHQSVAVGVLGDSISYGFPDLPPNGLFSALGSTLPVLNMALVGDTATGFVSTNTTRLQLAAYCSSFATNYGINDLNGGRSGAQVIADRTTIAGLLPGLLVNGTITPSALSSDNYATSGNQTTLGYNPQRVIVNTWVRSQTKFIELTTPLEFGLNSGIWRSVGDGSVIQATTSNGADYNGIHPLPYGYNVVTSSGNVNPALFT